MHELKRSALALAVHEVRLAAGHSVHDIASDTGLSWRQVDAVEQGVGVVPTRLLERVDRMIYAGPHKVTIQAELARRTAVEGAA